MQQGLTRDPVGVVPGRASIGVVAGVIAAGNRFGVRYAKRHFPLSARPVFFEGEIGHVAPRLHGKPRLCFLPFIELSETCVERVGNRGSAVSIQVIPLGAFPREVVACLARIERAFIQAGHIGVIGPQCWVFSVPVTRGEGLGCRGGGGSDWINGWACRWLNNRTYEGRLNNRMYKNTHERML